VKCGYPYYDGSEDCKEEELIEEYYQNINIVIL